MQSMKRLIVRYFDWQATNRIPIAIVSAAFFFGFNLWLTANTDWTISCRLTTSLGMGAIAALSCYGALSQRKLP